MSTKYISKSMRVINDELRVYQYIYRDRVDLYFTPRDAAKQAVRVSIPLHQVASVINDYENLCQAEEAKKPA